MGSRALTAPKPTKQTMNRPEAFQHPAVMIPQRKQACAKEFVVEELVKTFALGVMICENVCVVKPFSPISTCVIVRVSALRWPLSQPALSRVEGSKGRIEGSNSRRVAPRLRSEPIVSGTNGRSARQSLGPACAMFSKK
jgi:hypothetical protein